jgi:hypothetical protein
MGSPRGHKKGKKARQKIESTIQELQKEHPSVEHNECSICFDALCKRPLCVLIGNDGKRVCPHFLHASCAFDWLVHGFGQPSCPVCRTPCASALSPLCKGVMELPDFNTEPDNFFNCLDTNRDRVLDKTEAYHALKALMPVDKDGKWLSDNFNQLWKMWDINGDNVVNMYEFQAPRGLLQFVLSSCPSKGMQRAAWELPDFRIESQKLKWFRYWDEDFSGNLDINEVTRAMVKSFHLELSPGTISRVRRMLSEVWYNFDFDGDGTISEHEFVMKGGLWEMLMEQGAGQLSSTARAEMEEEGLRRGPEHNCPHCQEYLPGYVFPTTRTFQQYYKKMDQDNPHLMQAPKPPRQAPNVKVELDARHEDRTVYLSMRGHQAIGEDQDDRTQVELALFDLGGSSPNRRRAIHHTVSAETASESFQALHGHVHLCVKNASQAYNRRVKGPRGFVDHRTKERKDWHLSFDRYEPLPPIVGR